MGACPLRRDRRDARRFFLFPKTLCRDVHHGLGLAALAAQPESGAWQTGHPDCAGFGFVHRKQLRTSVQKPSNWGLLFLSVGFVLVVLGTRALQPRITMLAIPFLIFGSVLFVWGAQVARILAFPIGFLVFMIPVGALQQTSFRLQFLITGAVDALCSLTGIKINAVGTTLRAQDGSWGFDIAEGCSGIRSLVAIIMLTAIYTHVFEKVWWKKIILLACSIVFAVIANAGRIFTIILIARMGYPELAGGIYHEYSGFISFPVALGSMLLCHKLLNLGAGKRTLPGEPQPASP